MIRALVLVALFTTTSLAAPDPKQLAKDRAVAAEKIYQATVALLKSGRAIVESAYAWSVRALDADLDSGRAVKVALTDHLMRMTSLSADMISAKTAGVASTVDADAAAYFKLEAEYWVARGKR